MKRWLSTVLVVALLSACGGGPLPGETDEEGWSGIGQLSSVRLVEVSGVRCVVMRGYQSGGIDCDWPGGDG